MSGDLEAVVADSTAVLAADEAPPNSFGYVFRVKEGKMGKMEKKKKKMRPPHRSFFLCC